MLELGHTTTLVVLVLSLAFAFLADRHARRPADPLKGARLLPWRSLIIIAVIIALLMIVHLVNLAGIETGRLP